MALSKQQADKIGRLYCAKKDLEHAAALIKEALGESDVGLEYAAEIGSLVEELEGDISDVRNPAINR